MKIHRVTKLAAGLVVALGTVYGCRDTLVPPIANAVYKLKHNSESAKPLILENSRVEDETEDLKKDAQASPTMDQDQAMLEEMQKQASTPVR